MDWYLGLQRSVKKYLLIVSGSFGIFPRLSKGTTKMSSLFGRRSWMRTPWHFCDQCGIKTQTGEMRRNAGFLVCRQCFDVMILGELDVRRARVAASLPGREMQPVEKITGEADGDMGFEAIEF